MPVPGPIMITGARGVCGQAEAVRLLHEHRHAAPRAQVLGEEARAGAVIGAVVVLVAQHSDRQMHFARVLRLRGGDRVQARLHAARALRTNSPMRGRADGNSISTSSTSCTPKVSAPASSSASAASRERSTSSPASAASSA